MIVTLKETPIISEEELSDYRYVDCPLYGLVVGNFQPQNIMLQGRKHAHNIC